MLTPRQKWIVARMLHYAYQHTYHGLFVSRYTIFMAILQRSLVSDFIRQHRTEKVLFRFAEKHTLGYPVFSPLIANDSLLFRTDPFNMQHKNGRTRGIHPFHLWNLSSISMGGPKKNISIVSLNYLHC